jgi:hypothetical protein
MVLIRRNNRLCLGYRRCGIRHRLDFGRSPLVLATAFKESSEHTNLLIVKRMVMEVIRRRINKQDPPDRYSFLHSSAIASEIDETGNSVSLVETSSS